MSFFIFAFTFNTWCTTCMGLPNTSRTIHDSMSSLLFYLIVFLTPVIATLPRFFLRTLKNTLKPSDDIVAQVKHRNERQRGEKSSLQSWFGQATVKTPTIRWKQCEEIFSVPLFYVVARSFWVRLTPWFGFMILTFLQRFMSVKRHMIEAPN